MNKTLKLFKNKNAGIYKIIHLHEAGRNEWMFSVTDMNRVSEDELRSGYAGQLSFFWERRQV